MAWIQSHHLQWKFKLWAGMFAWGNKAKHCWALSTNFWKQKVCWHPPAMFCLIYLNNKFPVNSLNFNWRWSWWDQIQAIFLNLFYFIFKSRSIFPHRLNMWYPNCPVFKLSLIILPTWCLQILLELPKKKLSTLLYKWLFNFSISSKLWRWKPTLFVWKLYE